MFWITQCNSREPILVKYPDIFSENAYGKMHASVTNSSIARRLFGSSPQVSFGASQLKEQHAAHISSQSEGCDRKNACDAEDAKL